MISWTQDNCLFLASLNNRSMSRHTIELRLNFAYVSSFIILSLAGETFSNQWPVDCVADGNEASKR